MSEIARRPVPSALRREVGIPLLAVAVFVVLWELLVRGFKVPEFLLPAPSNIAIASWDVAGNLAMHSAATLKTVLLGFLASVLISFPMAMAITSSPAVGNAIYPLLVLTQSIPKVALAPLLVVILGANEVPRVSDPRQAFTRLQGGARRSHRHRAGIGPRPSSIRCRI